MGLLPIKAIIVCLISLVYCLVTSGQTAEVTNRISAQVLFQDNFQGKLGQGWYWLREHTNYWRVSPQGLEVWIEPGNMWGPQNDARNVLLRAAPSVAGRQIEISITVQNTPTNQYEQTDLVWYFDDSNMVKLGQELVDGKLSVVMGREEKDQTRTISITPLDSTTVTLRLVVAHDRISGAFRTTGSNEWKVVGKCELPRTPTGEVPPKISLQFYQGSQAFEHWSRVTDFVIKQGAPIR